MGGSVRLLGVAALMAAPLLVGAAVPAGARAAAPRLSFVVQNGPPVVVPNTNVTPKLAFMPAKLKARWTASKPTSTCTMANAAVTVTNTTRKIVTVTSDGETFFLLPAHAAGGICGWGTGKSVFEFGLQGSASRLSVRFS
jgi:hypothetical protein